MEDGTLELSVEDGQQKLLCWHKVDSFSAASGGRWGPSWEGEGA